MKMFNLWEIYRQATIPANCMLRLIYPPAGEDLCITIVNTAEQGIDMEYRFIRGYMFDLDTKTLYVYGDYRKSIY